MPALATHLVTLFRARLQAVPSALVPTFAAHVDLTKLAVGSTAANAIAAFGEALERVLSGPHAADASVGVRATAAIGGSAASDGP
jgi:hypothetical protein